ncbi:MAG: DUF512 domain-containing protein [Actinobacteria bacterium]|nr:DUF512 domain-containing protein [Actinomycetota bacterium]
MLEINGRPPLDILDYLETGEEKSVYLRLQRGGRKITRRVRKGAGIPLGLVFDRAVFDGVRTCINGCIFCFVDQMPPGLRETLYVKDDDYRLSFYYGNFITLNNLSAADVERIRRLRLSPLYVSLHATDPVLRSRLMGGNASKGLDILHTLLDEGIVVHLQVVLCPGINDGEDLRRTLREVLEDYGAASLGIVPVGLTSRTDALAGAIRPYDGVSAREVLRLVEEFQAAALEEYGRRLFYAADEFYLLAEEGFPGEDEYEGYPQLENGIGMARKFIAETLALKGAMGSEDRALRGVVTGVAGERVLHEALEGAGMGGVEVIAVHNRLMGGTVTVTALLGGADIIATLKNERPVSRSLLIPDSMLRDGLFIDDITLADVERETGYRLIPVEVNGARFVRALHAEEETG